LIERFGRQSSEEDAMFRAQPLFWAALALAGTAGTALAAPAQLLNKTIQFGWSTEVVQRGPDGQVVRPRIDASRTVYVSSAGRLFMRTTRANQKLGLKKGGDYAPGASTNKAGEATGLRFAGNNLVGNVAFPQGAAQVTVSFDASFSSCSLNIVYGREGGGMRRRGLDGKMYEIQSTSVSGQSCSVRAGNPFAGD
jgi:hypothetical protein